jgi:hypothetical protein
MPADNASKEQPDRSASDALAEQAEKARRAERYGVVEIARHVKDDGRALLLYSRVEDGPA